MSNEEDPRRPDRHDQYGWQGHSEDPDSAYGGWEPTPQGDGFDAAATAADATAFVHIPPEDLADIPLAAPGHGYVPPMIVPLTPAAGLDPAATGSWATRTRTQQAEAEQRARQAADEETGAVHWPDPNQQGGYRGPYGDTSHATAQWNFTDALGAPQAAPETGHHGAQDASGHGGPADHTGHQGHGGHTGHVDYAGLTDAFGHTGALGHAGDADRRDDFGQRDDFGHGDDFARAGYAEGAEHPGHTGHADHTGHLPQPGDFGPTDPAGHTNPAGPTDPAGLAGPTDPAGHTDLAGRTDSTGRTVAWPSPATDGDLPEASGEPPVPAPAQRWYPDSARPATLPGGAPAPWATQTPDAEPVPAPEPEPEADPVSAPETRQAPEAEPAAADPAGDATGQPDHADDAAPPTSPADAEGAADAPAADASGPDAPDLTADASPAEPGVPDGAAAGADPDVRAALEEAPATPHPEHGPTSEAEAEQRHAPESAPENAPEAERRHGPEAEAEPEAVLTPSPAPLDAPSDHPATSYVLHVNGMDRPVSDAWIGESLLYVLRERLGLAGAKDGCSQGECGACNVQVDGRLVASCLVPAATAAGSEVRTVEGLAVDGESSDVQRALAACGAVQCGFCIPGMAMTVHDLLEGNHAPTELETRQALCGNLCRCSGYRGVLDAVADVVASREASAEAAAPDGARIPHQAEPGAGGVQQVPHPHEGEAL
ncbi:2Fe-2S iron-sulfur cluster-binding protein [Streptomyces californicus]|uniref:(2Fe-2S)-binding protein n=1 Tax=Streptomyces californicus TaxID=67351 RepID=UPI0037B5E594